MTSDTAVNYNLVIPTGRSKIDHIFFTATPFHIITDTSLFVIEYQVNLNVGQQNTLTAIVLPSNAGNRTVRWSSSDTTVARVNTSGTVSATGGGDTYIKATSFSGFSDSCHVIVSFPIIADTSVVLSDTSINLTEGTIIHDTLTAIVYPLNATNRSVSWTSDDTSVVKVNANGILTAFSSGTAIIMASSYSGNTASCHVNVLPPFIRDTSVVMSDTIIYMVAGFASDTLTAMVLPLNASVLTLNWYSVDSNIAKTDQMGIVTPVYPGITYIKAVSYSGATGSCRIEVNMDDIEKNKPVYFSIYPNPVRDKLYLICSDRLAEITIYNVFGLKVYQSTENNNNMIDLSGYPKALYLIQIYSKGEKFSSKIIKE